jgi:hypothetical protein
MRFRNPFRKVASVRRIAKDGFAAPTLRESVDFLCKKAGAFRVFGRCARIKRKRKFFV